MVAPEEDGTFRNIWTASREQTEEGGEWVTVPDDRLCGLLLVKALVRDESGDGWGHEVEFTDADGGTKSRVVSAEMLHSDGALLFSTLSAAGLWITENPKGRQKFRQMLNTWRTEERVTEVSKSGWFGSAYMCPTGQVLGEVEGSYRLRDGAGAADREKGGTLEGWKAGVGHAVWQGDTQQFAFGMMTGCAGVIVQLCGYQTMGIHFVGESSRGKTTGQEAGASCVGNPFPDRGVLVTFRGTDNSFETKFEKANGSSLHVDEGKTGNAKALELLIFMGASGVGKSRLRADTTERKSKTWSTFWTFSSEKSLQAILEGVNGELVTGTAVRLASVSVDACPDIGKARADAVKAAARANYGHALPLFVGEIMKRGLHLRPDRLRRIVEWLGDQLPAKTVAAMRARATFGLLWLCGLVMKACGLVLGMADVGAVIRWAWDSFTGGTAQLDPKAANMAAVETYLRANVGVRVFKTEYDEFAPQPHQEVWAWYDAKVVYIRADKIESIPGVTLGKTAIMQAFADAGMLILPKKSTKGLVHSKVPKVGDIKNYRLAMVLRPGAEETAEEEPIDPALVAQLFTDTPRSTESLQ
jgi:hypothetical protein